MGKVWLGLEIGIGMIRVDQSVGMRDGSGGGGNN